MPSVKKVRVMHSDSGASACITGFLLSELSKWKADPVVLCVGTDRSTGDALGPLVGQRLVSLGLCRVIGTIDEPVGASALPKALDRIEHQFPGCPVVAVDAGLGKAENVGTIVAGCGSITPGAGVGKYLPAVGDLFVLGIVGAEGIGDSLLLLQTAPLSLVLRMADVIAAGIAGTLLVAEAAEVAVACEKGHR